MEDIIKRVDEWGRVIISPESLTELMLRGIDVSNLIVEDNDVSRNYNETCIKFDKTDFLFNIVSPLGHTPEEENAIRTKNWFISEEIQTIDVRSFLLSMCKSEEEISRVNHEMDLYEDRDLIPLLQLMIYLVDYFRTNKIVWGVGRGSSVSSFCLYLIGINRINPIKYGLDIKDFLK